MDRDLNVVMSISDSKDSSRNEEAAFALVEELRERSLAFAIVPAEPSRTPGAKDASQLITVTGQVLVAIASGGALTALIGAVQAWALRDNAKKVTIEIGGDKLLIEGGDDSHRAELAKAFLKRHSK